MITALDHIVLLCPDMDAAIADYCVVMGAKPVWRAQGDGAQTALFATGNMALELMAPWSEGEVADKLRTMVAGGARLTSLVYRSDDLAEDHRLMQRRGLAPGEISAGRSRDIGSGRERVWSRFRLPDARMAGIKSFVLERSEGGEFGASLTVGSVLELDHLVIATPNPTRAVANYGARLGLRLALERIAPEWQTHFLFFRLGGLTLEIIHRLNDATPPDADDAIWGLTWAVGDLEAARARLIAAGRDVSDIREGRKPGSRVFTLRDGTLGVATLFIHHASR